MKSETGGAYAALLVGTTIACISLVAYGLLENQSEGFVYANLTQQKSVCAQLTETLKVERDVIRETMAMYRTEADKNSDLAEKLEIASENLTEKCISLSASQIRIRNLSVILTYVYARNKLLQKQLMDAGIEPEKVPPYVIMKGEENDGS